MIHPDVRLNIRVGDLMDLECSTSAEERRDIVDRILVEHHIIAPRR